MKPDWIKLNVMSKLSPDLWEETDLDAAQIQTISDIKIQGRHYVSWVRLQGSIDAVPVKESSEEIHLELEYADHQMKPAKYYEKLWVIRADPNLNIDHEDRVSACDSSETHSIEIVMTRLAELIKGEEEAKR